VVDEQVLGHGIEVRGVRDPVAVVLDDADVHRVEGGEVLERGVAAHGVVLPPAPGHHGARGAGRRAAERGDPLGEFVAHLTDRVHLGVEHLVDGDEVGADDVPVDVLERQLQIDGGDQPVLQDVDHLGGGADLDAGHGVRGGVRDGGHGSPR
jgi:hypothetical protein